MGRKKQTILKHGNRRPRNLPANEDQQKNRRKREGLKWQESHQTSSNQWDHVGDERPVTELHSLDERIR